jgi:membrane protease YdiL (CAAX protease family)
MKTPVQILSAVKKRNSKNNTENLGGVAQIIAFAVGIFIASQLVAGIFVGVFLGILNGNKGIADGFDSAVSQFAYVLLAEATAIGLVYWLLQYKKVSLAKIGLGRWPNWKDLKSGLLGFGFYYAVLIIILALASWLIPSLNVDQNQEVGFDNLQGNLDQVFAFTSLVLLAPLGEEILMRGYLYSGLRSKMKFVPAMLLTSAIFGLAHLEFGNNAPLVWVAALSTFILSLVLVYKKEKTGALYAGILIHVLNNLVAFLVHF